ncbi:hypothetical protein PA598K_03278 [Paenibacillus sp. 598K]|uniref:cache domain-containing sensor histidine kinase n=1 Tax=Paenibacillus sp. 598K TaxID=1117987 RepID=UPI000FF9D254|nr:sensor histidine kinase [Paenibacillus sp. 598K]GBF74908.1 hypothetical protein PA598K_03278 [Paenibacillus sp. 598K]
MKALTRKVIRYFGKSLYRKMMLTFFLIVVITVSVLITDFYFRTAEDLRRQAVESSARITQQSAYALNAHLDNVRRFAWTYFRDFEFQSFVKTLGSDPDAISNYSSKFSHYVNDNPIVWSVSVEPLEGFSMRAGHGTPDMLPEEKERLTQLAVEANGKGVWVSSEIYGPNLQTEQTLTFLQAIRSISLTSPGPVIGVMMYNLSFVSLEQWFAKVEGEQSNRTYIISKTDGTVIHSLLPEERGASLLRAEELAAIRGVQEGLFYADRGSGEELVLYGNLDRTDWMLVTMIPMRQLSKPVDDFTRRTLLLGALSLVCSMLLAGVFYSRTITPLRELSKGMKAIEVGNYEVSLPVRSYDELGYITSSFNRMAKEINRLIIKVYESELLKKNAEIKMLQSQINPHFLYNTLGIIDSLSSIEGDTRVAYISRSLAKMFRYNISGEDISTLEAEIQQSRLYLSIQKIRFDQKFDYLIYVEPGLEQMPIPKLLFQPIVENSILHGVSRSSELGMVRIEVYADDDTYVQLKIWNNGAPIEPERMAWLRERLYDTGHSSRTFEDRSSIGLLNVQERIRLLYGDDCGIAWESSKAYGTAFTLTIKRTLANGGTSS